MKRILKGIGCAVISLPALLIAGVIALFVGAIVVDELALPGYRQEVLDSLSLPAGAQVVETVSGCGNTGPTGNHTELYVAVLVHTSDGADALRQQFPYLHDAAEDGLSTGAMEQLGLAFTEPDTATGAQKDYYILEFFKEAPMSDFDLRGH